MLNFVKKRSVSGAKWKKYPLIIRKNIPPVLNKKIIPRNKEKNIPRAKSKNYPLWILLII